MVDLEQEVFDFCQKGIKLYLSQALGATRCQSCVLAEYRVRRDVEFLETSAPVSLVFLHQSYEAFTIHLGPVIAGIPYFDVGKINASYPASSQAVFQGAFEECKLDHIAQVEQLLFLYTFFDRAVKPQVFNESLEFVCKSVDETEESFQKCPLVKVGVNEVHAVSRVKELMRYMKPLKRFSEALLFSRIIMK